MMIYKIFRISEWDELVAKGETQGAPIDIQDGFVHFSTKDQVEETAAKHFASSTDLVLAALDANSLGPDLKWEKSRNDDDFPHLYRLLKHNDIIWMKPLPWNGTAHDFPEGME